MALNGPDARISCVRNGDSAVTDRVQRYDIASQCGCVFGKQQASATVLFEHFQTSYQIDRVTANGVARSPGGTGHYRSCVHADANTQAVIGECPAVDTSRHFRDCQYCILGMV